MALMSMNMATVVLMMDMTTAPYLLLSLNLTVISIVIVIIRLIVLVIVMIIGISRVSSGPCLDMSSASRGQVDGGSRD